MKIIFLSKRAQLSIPQLPTINIYTWQVQTKRLASLLYLVIRQLPPAKAGG